MKIRVDAGELPVPLYIWCPNALLSSRFVSYILRRCAPENIPSLVEPVLDELTAFARTHPGFVLVDVETADGEKVKITL